MPRITVYLDETQLDFVKKKGPGFMRRLVQKEMTVGSRVGQIAPPAQKVCPPLSHPDPQEVRAARQVRLEGELVSDATQYAVVDVLIERDKQDEKWGVQDHGLLTWNAILGEERGEFEQALLEAAVFDNGRHKEFGPAQVRHELVQVCAVALAMIECIDRNGVTP